MSKLKIIIFLAIIFVGYKAITSISGMLSDFDQMVQRDIEVIEESLEMEKEADVIGLMMYLGEPLELVEHLYMTSKKKCLKSKEIAEETSYAYYECAKIKAIVKANKIVSIIEEIRVF